MISKRPRTLARALQRPGARHPFVCAAKENWELANPRRLLAHCRRWRRVKAITTDVDLVTCPACIDAMAVDTASRLVPREIGSPAEAFEDVADYQLPGQTL